eukprot:CAMPEP_0194120384 /NCGR_PEP_ID=MMETSP0150-20130528/43291_1 /TAXON_ID=122233 /ORGANISM="Chaetoceros debilis, Strain MM31A-1" /LENGTH=492 /DNA_ID=CAMNT_0038812485 /DNA_START=15 /DNA_END=1493 /DNA_ORIENTATION=-
MAARRQHALCPPYGGNKEALGWALNGAARMIAFVGPGVFLATAIINLAKKEAGCVLEIPEGSSNAPECNERIYGLRPSSFITTYGTVVGLISAVCLPVVGAVLDHTRRRRLVGLVSSMIHIACMFAQIFLTENNWFMMVLIQIVAALAGWMHTLAVYAYLPELTDDPDLLVSWTANFQMIQYASLLLFLMYMLGILYATGYNDDDILSARISMISSTAIAMPSYLWTWMGLMKARDAFHPLPEGSSLWTIGFQRVYNTSKKICGRYRALMWFLINVMIVEAGQASIASIALTYLTDTLQMSTAENGIAILLLFAFGILGALVAKKSVNFMNPIYSNQLCQVVTGANTAIAVIILYGPGQQIQAYIVASVWGICAGWKICIERFTICQIIPKNQDAELMGFYLFSSQVLIWFPTLIFTAMNEAGVNQRAGLSILIAFFLGGIVSLWMMGPYEEAVSLAREESDMLHDQSNIAEQELDEEEKSTDGNGKMSICE